MYTVIDFETTGLSPDESVVIEIGAVKLNSMMGVMSKYTTRVALPEGVEVPEFITNLTGITSDDLIGATPSDTAFEYLKEFIGGDYIVAHNAPFDLSFLYKYLPDEDYHFIDTRAIIKLIEPEESAKLQDVVKRYGINYENHHHALSDCEMTADVLRHLRDKLLVEKRESILHYLDVAVDSEERPLTFVPKNAKVTSLSK